MKNGPRAELEKLLRELPREDVLFLLLGYADGLTDAEIGKVLSVNSGAVARHRATLIERLRCRLGRAPVEGEYLYVKMWRPVKHRKPVGAWKPCCLQLPTTKRPLHAPRQGRGEEEAYFRVPVSALEYVDLPPPD